MKFDVANFSVKFVEIIIKMQMSKVDNSCRDISPLFISDNCFSVYKLPSKSIDETITYFNKGIMVLFLLR